MANEIKESDILGTVDCTPTWNWTASVYLAVLQQEWSKKKPNPSAVDNAVKGIYEMAGHLDRINKENKEKK